MFAGGPENLPVAYVVPRSAYRTGMTAAEARETPLVIAFHESDLTPYQLERFRAQRHEPVILIAHERGAQIAEPEFDPRVVKEVHILKYVPEMTIAPRKTYEKPKLSRHDLNPRKGRR